MTHSTGGEFKYLAQIFGAAQIFLKCTLQMCGMGVVSSYPLETIGEAVQPLLFISPYDL